MDMNISQWKIEVERIVRNITGDEIDNNKVIYQDLYDNGYSPEIGAFLTIKDTTFNINYYNYHLWQREIKKYLSIFIKNHDINDDNMLYELYHKNTSPLSVAENILKNIGYLPQISSDSILSSSPPKI